MKVEKCTNHIIIYIYIYYIYNKKNIEIITNATVYWIFEIFSYKDDNITQLFKDNFKSIKEIRKLFLRWWIFILIDIKFINLLNCLIYTSC
jgi:hypothetical protein